MKMYKIKHILSLSMLKYRIENYKNHRAWQRHKKAWQRDGFRVIDNRTNRDVTSGKTWVIHDNKLYWGCQLAPEYFYFIREKK